MTARAEDLVTAEQRGRRGRWSPWREAPPVAASDIRRWALAVYWPEQPPRRFLDERAVATGSQRGGLVAPREFNPFAWLPDGAGGSTSLPPGVRRISGGCRIVYGEDIAVGDVVRRRVRLDGWDAKSGSSGDFLVVRYTHEWRNQRNRLVRMAEYALIHRSTTGAPA